MSEPGPTSASAPPERTFEQLMERLRVVVEKLETGQLPLEEALKVFEEGVVLARHGHGLLEAAEKRVELLVRGPEEVVPFPEG
jgi:exodeoxyribonuclease VII small subunit